MKPAGRRILSSAAAILAALLVAAPALACDYYESGPSDCGPLALYQSATRELTASVGPCYEHYGFDSPANRAGAYGAVWVTGPNGFRVDLAPNCFYFTVCQLKPTKVLIPGAGTYTLVSTTFGYSDRPGDPPGNTYCYSGRSELRLTVAAPPTGTPRPVTSGATPTPVAVASTPRPTPFYPLPDVGLLGPGPAAATRLLPLLASPNGNSTGLVVEAGESVSITGPPVVAGGRYWYPVRFASIDGYVGAGTGTDAWLVAVSTPTPPATGQAASATQTVAPAAGDASQPLQQAPNIVLVSAAFGIVLLALVAWWAMRGPAALPPQ